MLKDTDRVIVICPHCGSESKQTIRNLKNTASFRCGCGGIGYTDINQIEELAREEQTNMIAKLRLRSVPP